MIPVHALRTLMRTTAPSWRAEDGHAEFWMYAPVNDGMAWIGRFRGCSDWTRHPDADAWFQQLDGTVRVTVLTPDGRHDASMQPGDAMVIPRGHWYRIDCDGWIEQMGIAPSNTEHRAEDPDEL